MRKSIFSVIVLASVLAPPVVSHADTIDDFVLIGGGHTISYSLPSVTIFPDDLSVEFFMASAPTTIDGVPGYAVLGQYDAIPSQIGTLQLDVPESIFGYPAILFQGPLLVSTAFVPSSDPFNQLNVVATFIPGTYDLMGAGQSFPLETGPFLPYTLTVTPQTPTAATPEPSSLLLLATGLLGFAGFMAMKRRSLGSLPYSHSPDGVQP